MPASLDHTHPGTPMGANLLAGGATFRVWAPNAHSVHVVGDFNGRVRDDTSLLNRGAGGHWLGFLPGVRDRDRYMFYVVGDGGEGPKRDPYARELEAPFPGECVVRRTDFPWHETGYVTPPFHDFVIYQLHVGTFFTPNLPAKGGTFLDVARKLPHLAGLGVTAVQLMPIQEFQTQFSLGYNGTDYFSPEMDFAVPDADLGPYVERLNGLLDAKGLTRYAPEDLRGEMNQLKALVDLCHVHGLAVLIDVVYNHAGGDFGDESIYFFDRQSDAGGNRNSLYFTDVGHAGGLVFDFGKPEVRAFLIQNAKFFLGQEFLEDKQWSDNFEFDKDLLLHWAGPDAGDKQMLDHVRFTSELLRLRRQQSAQRGQGFRVVHAHDENRVLAFQRWVEGEGRDVLVVAHLSTFNRFGYRIGFPGGGGWREIFNSDVYESWINPEVVGNGGRVFAEPSPLHGFGHSAALVLPANSVLVFAR